MGLRLGMGDPQSQEQFTQHKLRVKQYTTALQKALYGQGKKMFSKWMGSIVCTHCSGKKM